MSAPRPDWIFEIFLQPGEWYFGDEATRIRTLLGSCVSVVLWHPRARTGGMCHYLLPSRNRARPPGEPASGRYGDEAIALLVEAIERSGTHPEEYEARIFGGGNMFPGAAKPAGGNVGQRNIEAAKSLVRDHGFRHVCGHSAGDGHRNVIFDVWSGEVWVRHAPPAGQAAAQEPPRAAGARRA